MQLTGGEIVAEYLIREDIPLAIGIPGHGCLGLLDAFHAREKNLRVIQVRQENSAVHMADGYYRATGQPLAVFTSSGPGALNAVVGVATAYVDSSPILMLIGDTPTHMRGKGALQEIERQGERGQARIFEPITKRTWAPLSPGTLPSILRKAFAHMMTGRRGPVVLSLPTDVQCDSVDVQIPDSSRHMPTAESIPAPEGIERAARLLRAAKRPVILAGGGVNAGAAWDELRIVAEWLGAAVVTTLAGKGCFPEDHSLSGWLTGAKGTSCGLKLTSTADMILAVGCRFAARTTSSYRRGVSFAIPPTKLIHVDVDPQEIGKNYPVEIGIVGDAKPVLGRLIEALERDGGSRDYHRSPYFREIGRLREEWLAQVARRADEGREPRDPMTISALLAETRSFLDRDAIVVSSSGNTQSQILQEFPFYEPRTNITTGGFSTMGFALPAALGAKLAYPRRQVVAIVGDGDFSMSLPELATAVQYGLSVVVIVANNMGWISTRDLQIEAYGEDRVFATAFLDRNDDPYSPHFAEMAQAFGAHGERIRRAGEVRQALDRAFASGRPAVVEAIVSSDYPYSGAPAVGWYDVPVPTYLKKRRKRYEKEREGEVLG